MASLVLGVGGVDQGLAVLLDPVAIGIIDVHLPCADDLGTGNIIALISF